MDFCKITSTHQEPYKRLVRDLKRLIRDLQETYKRLTINKQSPFCTLRDSYPRNRDHSGGGELSLLPQTGFLIRDLQETYKRLKIKKQSTFLGVREKREKRLTPEPNFRFCPKQGSSFGASRIPDE